MSLAIVARGDQGGVAAQTLEMCRHVAPDRILLLDAGSEGRGATRIERFEGLAPELRVSPTTHLLRGDIAWLLEASTIYTAEGTYGYELPLAAARAGVRLVVHANPELWTERSRDAATTVVVCPTEWEINRVPGARLMAMPVDRVRLRYRPRTQARTFWHPTAPAMEDRNGTNIVRAALAHLGVGCRLLITGVTAEAASICEIGKVTVETRGHRDNYWDTYDEADVLVMPRRYGGLCLPVQEALSAGLPVIMLDTGPYAGKGGVLTIPTNGSYPVPMKGGMFSVYEGDPRLLADEIAALVYDPTIVERASKAADEHAETLSWVRWEEPWWTFLHA